MAFSFLRAVPGRSKRWHLTRLARASILNLLSLLVLFLLAEFVAERTWLTTLLAYAPPLLYTPVTGVLLLIALLRRNRNAVVLTLLASLLLAGPIVGLLHVPRPVSLATNQPHLRLMTWNIGHGTGGPHGIATVVRGASPDVLCLQEVSAIAEAPDPLPALIRALPEYRWERAGEVAIGSRLPIGKARECPLLTRAGVYRVALAVPVMLPGRSAPVMVTTVHLATAATAESLSLRKSGIPAYLRRTTGARSEQIERLNDFQRELSGPAIICGDFNTPPRGILYRRVSEGRTDVWGRAGWGAGWTFSSKHPLLRIDHIFTSPDIIPVSCRTLAISPAVSDHLPVVTELSVTPN